MFGRSEADLQAVEVALEPTLRQAILPGPSYEGGDAAWDVYAERLGIDRVHRDRT